MLSAGDRPSGRERARGKDGSPQRVAVVQVAPVVLDRAATLDLVVAKIEEAADTGADCDPHQATADHRTLDVAGHYGRPDVFRLSIDRTSRRPISIDET